MKTQIAAPVVVAIDHRYNDNAGAYSIAFFFGMVKALQVIALLMATVKAALTT